MNTSTPVIRLLLLLPLFAVVSCKEQEQKELQGLWQHDTTRTIVYEQPSNREVSDYTERITGNSGGVTLKIGESIWHWSHFSAFGSNMFFPCTYTLKGDKIRVEGQFGKLPDYTLRRVNDLQLVLTQERILPQQNTRTAYEHTFSRVR